MSRSWMLTLWPLNAPDSPELRDAWDWGIRLAVAVPVLGVIWLWTVLRR